MPRPGTDPASRPQAQPTHSSVLFRLAQEAPRGSRAALARRAACSGPPMRVGLWEMPGEIKEPTTSS